LLRSTTQFFQIINAALFCATLPPVKNLTQKAGTKKPGKGFVKSIEKATQVPPMF